MTSIPKAPLPNVTPSFIAHCTKTSQKADIPLQAPFMNPELLAPRNRIRFETPVVPQLVKYITSLIKKRHWTLLSQFNLLHQD